MKIGFLPLYVALYDSGTPFSFKRRKERHEPFYETLAQAFEAQGIEVVRSPLCRVKEEFSAAVSLYEAQGVDCIVTWHAAYSPSLECVDALTGTDLPLVVLDTTETYDFGPTQEMEEISYCHGIHGVMDMCNLLKRRGKAYAIAAGHYPSSDVLDKAIGYVKAAVAARALPGSKVGTIGGPMDGMGDFRITDEEFKERFGVTVVHADGEEIRALKEAVTEEAVDNEIAADLENAVIGAAFSEETHRRTARNSLAVRRWLENNGLAAFTANFDDITPATGLDIMPFMEACKAQARGVGYAGEGDVLTAALTGALLKGFTTAAFVEIFCPDWANNTLFLSHFAEINYALIQGKPSLREIEFSYGDAQNPVVGYACLRSGEATFVNLFRDNEGYKLVVAPVTMEAPTGENKFTTEMSGWMRPQMPIARFLEKLSYAGATHHSALVYDATPEQLAFFGRLLGLEVIEL